MSDPLKLADEIEEMDEYGSRASDRRLIAAALRLAEAIREASDCCLDLDGCSRLDDLDAPGLLDAYEAARDAK